LPFVGAAVGASIAFVHGSSGGPVTASIVNTRRGVSLRLLGGLVVAEGESVVSLPSDAQRVLALLALAGPSLPRSVVAGTLWFDASQDHANGSLRSAVWRLRRCVSRLIEADARVVSLRPEVAVDVATVSADARRFCAPDACIGAYERVDIEPFTRELLPGWYDEWTIVERERVRQLSLHALEAIARCLVVPARFAEAVDAAIAAISLDPLRETAHRVLITIHHAEGNPSEARRHYRSYRTLLRDTLGLEPSRDLTRIAFGVTPAQRPPERRLVPRGRGG
jgi:DNA-binding SARP family transcriptional activator